MNDLHVLYKLLIFSQERLREYWGNRWSGKGSKERKKRKGEKKEKAPLDFFNRRHLPVALAFAYWKEENEQSIWNYLESDSLGEERINNIWSWKVCNAVASMKKDVNKKSFSKIPVDDGNGKDFHFPLARLHIQSLSFLVRWTFYEICPIRTGNNRDESGGDCEFAFKHRANIRLQTSSMPINISLPDNATDKLKIKKGLGGLISIVVKPGLPFRLLYFLS